MLKNPFKSFFTLVEELRFPWNRENRKDSYCVRIKYPRATTIHNENRLKEEEEDIQGKEMKEEKGRKTAKRRKNKFD